MERIDIDDVLEQDHINTFEGADKEAQEIKELKSNVNISDTRKSAGRKKIGKTLSKNKITFYVDDEQLEYMENLTNKKERTPNAIAKKLFIADFELHKEN